VNLPVDSGRRGHDGLCDENAGVTRCCSARPVRPIHHGFMGADVSTHHNLQARKLRMAGKSITADCDRRNWLFLAQPGIESSSQRTHKLSSLILVPLRTPTWRTFLQA